MPSPAASAVESPTTMTLHRPTERGGRRAARRIDRSSWSARPWWSERPSWWRRPRWWTKRSTAAAGSTPAPATASATPVSASRHAIGARARQPLDRAARWRRRQRSPRRRRRRARTVALVSIVARRTGRSRSTNDSTATRQRHGDPDGEQRDLPEAGALIDHEVDRPVEQVDAVADDAERDDRPPRQRPTQRRVDLEADEQRRRRQRQHRQPAAVCGAADPTASVTAAQHDDRECGRRDRTIARPDGTRRLCSTTASSGAERRSRPTSPASPSTPRRRPSRQAISGRARGSDRGQRRDEHDAGHATRSRSTPRRANGHTQ